MNTQRDEFAERLRKAEDNLAQFGIDHGITNLDEQMSLQLRLISDNTNLRSVAAQQIDETAARLDAVHKDLAGVPQNVQMFAESARSQTATGLTDNLVKLQIQRRDLLARYQADFPLVRDVDRQIAGVRAQIAGDPAREGNVTRLGRNTLYDDLHREEITLSSQLQGLKAKKAQLEVDAARLQARSDEMAGLARHYRDLSRTRDVLDQSYRSISRSSEETQLSGALERASGANVRVVQPPDAPLAGRNPSQILYAGGIVLGIFAALAVFTLLNATRQVFVSVRDVERQLDLPVLLAVPFSARRAIRRTAHLADGWCSGRASAFEHDDRGRCQRRRAAATVAAFDARCHATRLHPEGRPGWALRRAAHRGAQRRGRLDAGARHLPRLGSQRCADLAVRRRDARAEDGLAAQHIRHADRVAGGAERPGCARDAARGGNPACAGRADWHHDGADPGLGCDDRAVAGVVRPHRDRRAGFGAVVHRSHAGPASGYDGHRRRGREHAGQRHSHAA